jgi:hypothetical protein
MEPVPPALELQDLLAPGEGARHAAGEHGGLGPGGQEPELLGAWDRVDDHLRQADGRLGEPVEGRAPHDLLLHRPDHRGVRVPEEQRTGAEDVVEVGPAAHVHDPRPLAVVDDERELGWQGVLAEARSGQDRAGRGQELAGPALQRFEFDRHRRLPLQLAG